MPSFAAGRGGTKRPAKSKENDRPDTAPVPSPPPPPGAQSDPPAKKQRVSRAPPAVSVAAVVSASDLAAAKRAALGKGGGAAAKVPVKVKAKAKAKPEEQPAVRASVRGKYVKAPAKAASKVRRPASAFDSLLCTRCTPAETARCVIRSLLASECASRLVCPRESRGRQPPPIIPVSRPSFCRVPPGVRSIQLETGLGGGATTATSSWITVSPWAAGDTGGGGGGDIQEAEDKGY